VSCSTFQPAQFFKAHLKDVVSTKKYGTPPSLSLLVSPPTPVCIFPCQQFALATAAAAAVADFDFLDYDSSDRSESDEEDAEKHHPGNLEPDEEKFADYDDDYHGDRYGALCKSHNLDEYVWNCCGRAGDSRGCVSTLRAARKTQAKAAIKQAKELMQLAIDQLTSNNIALYVSVHCVLFRPLIKPSRRAAVAAVWCPQVVPLFAADGASVPILRRWRASVIVYLKVYSALVIKVCCIHPQGLCACITTGRLTSSHMQLKALYLMRVCCWQGQQGLELLRRRRG
jgi:hypothetical protein